MKMNPLQITFRITIKRKSPDHYQYTIYLPNQIISGTSASPDFAFCRATSLIMREYEIVDELGVLHEPDLAALQK